jgi:DeoR/GlpR family transcriptional regulator of sugar metabolism
LKGNKKMSQEVTVDSLLEQIKNSQETICRKLKYLEQQKDAKKDAMAAFKEQIKETQDQLDEEMGNLDNLKASLATLGYKLPEEG